MVSRAPHLSDGRAARGWAGWAVATVVVLAACVSGASAESIWEKGQGAHAFLYGDNVAAEIGDSLTVVISDQSSFKNKRDRKMEKTTSSSGSAYVKTPIGGLKIAPGDLEQESSRTFDGSNDYTVSSKFADSITVTVMDRLPNGNLVVAGRSERHIAGEDTVTILTGIVKPEDIPATNTVSSVSVAHLTVHYETTGQSTGYVDQGWLNAILNYVWPF
jgi:flagellar L-ring protein precursor FlgH